VTADQPRHRSSTAPAPFAARWRELAACRGTDLNLFFPGRGESAGPARRTCARCPVRRQCLEFAVSNRIVCGIWGGLTGPERRALQSDWLRAARRDRDEAILTADAAGLTAEAIARSFGLSRMTVTRIARSGNQGGRAEPERFASRVSPPRRADDDRTAR
jgi:WhiB family transcriptional regulator, redox-sensing transcriptional regulator